MTRAAEIISDPNWFPARLDVQARAINFIQTHRSALSAAAFLDERFASTGAQTASVPLADILAAPPPQSPAPKWIFHTAFCCSTLMARGLDVPGRSVSLKEPGILMDLANAERMRAQNRFSDTDIARLYDAVFALLSRQFLPGEAVIIKPTNPANPVASQALNRGHQAIFMVSELKDFLISVLKKGESCKAFMRTLFNIFALDPAPLGQIPQRQALTFTDLQIAGLVQRHQMEFMTALGAAFPNQSRAFDGNKLPLQPSLFLSAAAEFFELGWQADTAATQARSEIFSTNSKFDDQAYDAGTRAQDAAVIEAANADALNVTLQWAETLTLGGPAAMPPAAALA